MEGLWGLSGSTTAGPFFDEGARHLRAHYVRERSPRLRQDKIAEFRRLHGRLYCELCMDTGAQKYPPDYCDRIYEVHHRAPLATASTPVKTTLDALAILCANCHRSVHATTDVDANFDLLAEHFTRS
jgi:5-methylcytosine-specific restriction protein A